MKNQYIYRSCFLFFTGQKVHHAKRSSGQAVKVKSYRQWQRAPATRFPRTPIAVFVVRNERAPATRFPRTPIAVFVVRNERAPATRFPIPPMPTKTFQRSPVATSACYSVPHTAYAHKDVPAVASGNERLLLGSPGRLCPQRRSSGRQWQRAPATRFPIPPMPLRYP